MDTLEIIGIVCGILIFFIFIGVQIWYLWSLYKTMKAVPEEHHMFPAWFIWLMIIPFVGLIFSWIMVPFGVPKTLEAASGNNIEMKNASKTLFALGLAQMILFTLGFVHFIGLVTIIAGFVLWVIYWVKVVSFKTNFLDKPTIVKKEKEALENE